MSDIRQAIYNVLVRERAVNAIKAWDIAGILVTDLGLRREAWCDGEVVATALSPRRTRSTEGS